jgi:hypothetical protein
MYGYSKQWAPDPQIYELTSIHVAGIKTPPGTAGAWQVRFVSPSLGQSRVYTSSMTPFRIEAAKVDSDKAWEVASKKGAEYATKNPDMVITYQLAQTSSYNNAAWRVIWGESAGHSTYSILVDASTGEYVKTLR